MCARTLPSEPVADSKIRNPTISRSVILSLFTGFLATKSRIRAYAERGEAPPDIFLTFGCPVFKKHPVF